jgi:hypothetical protein
MKVQHNVADENLTRKKRRLPLSQCAQFLSIGQVFNAASLRAAIAPLGKLCRGLSILNH